MITGNQQSKTNISQKNFINKLQYANQMKILLIMPRTGFTRKAGASKAISDMLP